MLKENQRYSQVVKFDGGPEWQQVCVAVYLCMCITSQGWGYLREVHVRVFAFTIFFYTQV